MRKLARVFLLILAAAFVATLALGQGVEVPAPEATVDWAARIEAGLLTWLPRLMALASILAAVFPSVGKVMKIVDVLAVNYGKARNDPKIQRWGG